jgi:general nucleoside transport system permease protein
VIGDFVSAVWNVFTSDTMYFSAFRLAALLAFAAAGEWIAERAGTLNISVEGMMLAGAFASAVGYDLTTNAVVGLLFGMGAGLLVAYVQATMSHRLTADQFVVGLTLNVLVLGLAAFLDSNLSPHTALAKVVEIPVLSDLPLLGQALFAQTWPTYLVYPVVAVAGWLVYRTRWGLEVRAVGENPQAADVSGIPVNLRRRQAILVEGMMAGLGGGYLVLGQVGSFEAGAVGGRGFIAIAAVIFGGWTLWGTIFGCLVFGMADAFRLAMPTLGYQANPQLLGSLPYLLTVVVMIVFARANRQPRALARPFVRGLT